MRDNIGMSDLNNGDDCDDCDDHGHHNVDDNIWLYVWHEWMISIYDDAVMMVMIIVFIAIFNLYLCLFLLL